MSESINSNILVSGVPQKQVQFAYDPRDSTYKGIQIGHYTSGSEYITGSSFQVIACASTGVFRCPPLQAKSVTFVNQRDPMYRVYKNNESGNATYLNWIPVNSGGFHNRVEIKGVQNLNELAIQTDNTATSTLSGVCIVYS